MMPRAVSGVSATLLSDIIRLIVSSQFSGDARLSEMRVIRFLSSEAWHEPQAFRTSGSVTGMPSSDTAFAAR
jgi:hypothetical protein